MSIIGDGIMLGAGGESASIFVTGLSETDTVLAASADLNPEWKVPNGYTQLEYIESSGTQYINTGVLAKDITDSFIDFQFVSTGDAELQVMATYVDSNNKLQCGWSGSTFMQNSGATYSYSYVPDASKSSTVRNLATVVPVGSPAYTVYLFAQNEKDAVKWQCSAKIYSCKISTSSGMVRDFVPAKRNSDGTVGLYDSINDLFYTNSGTGTFIAGKKAQQYIDFYEPEYSNLPEAYSQLEYIESSGTQYIDTGVVLNSTELTGTIDFQTTADPTNTDQWVSGAINSEYTIGIEGGIYKSNFFTALGFDYSQTYNPSARTTASFSVASGMTNEFTLLLFGRNVGGTPRSQFTGKIYSAKIRNGSTMLRNFIPAKRNTDSVLGLYDLVNGVFYTNGGDGEFIAGPVYEKKPVVGKWMQEHNPALRVLPDRLPAGYIQLKYIESTGTQYINTGVIPSNDLVAHFTNFSASGNTVNYSVFLGSQTQDNANDSWEFRIHPTDGLYLLDIYGETRVRANIVQNCDIVLDKSGITINGTKTAFSTTPSTISATHPLWIFASNTGGSAFRPSKASFSYLTLSDANGLLRDYVPVKRVSDGEIGLYDLVSDSFFTNAGTGTFAAGAEIQCEYTQYTQLEYIESSGTQYIDTGFVPTLNTKAEFKITSSSTQPNLYPQLFGAQELSNGTNRFGITGDWTARTGSTNLTASSDIRDTSFEGSLEYNKYILDGVVHTVTGSWTPADASLYLFNSHDASGYYDGTVTLCSAAQFYYFKLYDNGNLVRDFVPAKRNSDDVVGLYDLVNDVFYTNSGTGTFTAGAEVPQYFIGFKISPIKSYGTYTVTATDGTKTATSDVVVDSAIEYAVKMGYKLWLYKDGDECEDVTGGWVKGATTGYGTSTFNKLDSTLYLYAKGASGYGAKISADASNAIDFGAYDTLFIDVQSASMKAGSTTSSHASSLIVNLKNEEDTSYDGITLATATTTTVSSLSGVVSVDVSKYTGATNIMVKVYAGSNTSSYAEAYVSKIWLE